MPLQEPGNACIFPYIIYKRHEDISTTMVYVKTDNRLKNEAINKLTPKVVNEGKLPDWGKDKELMDFLNSLD